MEIKEIASKFQEAFNLVQNEQAAIMITEQYCLDQRTKFISEHKKEYPMSQNKNADMPLIPATPKQVETLKKFKKYREGISKIEATQIIGELFK